MVRERDDDHLAAAEDNHDVEARLDQQLIDEHEHEYERDDRAVIDLIKRTGRDYVNVIFFGRSYLYDGGSVAGDRGDVLVTEGPGKLSRWVNLGTGGAPGNDVSQQSTV